MPQSDVGGVRASPRSHTQVDVMQIVCTCTKPAVMAADYTSCLVILSDNKPGKPRVADKYFDTLLQLKYLRLDSHLHVNLNALSF